MKWLFFWRRKAVIPYVPRIEVPKRDYYAYAPTREPETDIYWDITQKLLFETGEKRRKLVRLLRHGYGFGMSTAPAKRQTFASVVQPAIDLVLRTKAEAISQWDAIDRAANVLTAGCAA